ASRNPRRINDAIPSDPQPPLAIDAFRWCPRVALARVSKQPGPHSLHAVAGGFGEIPRAFFTPGFNRRSGPMANRAGPPTDRGVFYEGSRIRQSAVRSISNRAPV